MSLQQTISVIMQATGVSAFTSSMGSINSAAAATQTAVGSLVRSISPLQAAIAGAVGGFTLASIAKLGSEFENTQNKMAGFMTALGEAPDFQTGLKLAATTMRQIEISAAALPGEAEDYVRVFTTALPEVQKSVGGTLKEMTKFTNNITAVGATFGIDSRQIGMDLKRMLQVGKGGAGLDNRTFAEMLPFLTQIEGQASLTSEAFNKMTSPERAELLKKAVGSLGPMIDNARTSWDAVSGSASAAAKTMFRLSTEDIFASMKTNLSAVTELFFDSDGAMTDLAQNIVATSNVISTHLIGAVSGAVDKLIWLGTTGPGMVAGFLSSLSFSPGQVLDQAANALAGVFQNMLTVIEPLASFAADLGMRIAEMAFTLLPPLIDGLYVLLNPVIDLARSIIGVVDVMVDYLWPSMLNLYKAIGELFTGVSDFLFPVFKILGNVIMFIVEQFQNYLLPVLKVLYDVLALLVRGIAKALSSLGNAASEYYGWKKPEMGKDATAGAAGFFSGLMDEIAAAKAKRMSQTDDIAGVAKGKRRETPAARGGTKVTQDFRYSRFTIDQKFADGWDPERIAVAFAKDLSKVSTRQLQSGFEPLNGLR